MVNEGVVIHPAKLPATGAKSNLLIRPADGITTSADPKRAGWRYLSFRSFALATGETAVVPHPEEEAIVITLGGGGFGSTTRPHRRWTCLDGCRCSQGSRGRPTSHRGPGP